MATFESVMYGELSLEVMVRRWSWEYASHFIFRGGRQLSARVQKTWIEKKKIFQRQGYEYNWIIFEEKIINRIIQELSENH